MLLHELTTNAAKYGALSEINGHIEIRWLRLSDDRLRLTWSEAGGPVITPPTRHGFGTHVMETLIKLDLGGQLRFDWRPAGSYLRDRASSLTVGVRRLQRVPVMMVHSPNV